MLLEFLYLIDQFCYRPIILILHFHLNPSVIVIQKLHISFLRYPLILTLHRLKPLLHPILQLYQELSLNITHRNLTKFFQANLLCIFINLHQFFFKHRTSIFKLILNILLELLIRIILSFQTFILANVTPSRLNIWYSTLVYRLHICQCQIE